jgi:hypothetical protein
MVIVARLGVALALVFVPAAVASGLDGTKHVVERVSLAGIEADFSYFATSRTKTFDNGGKKTTYTETTYSKLRISLISQGKLVFSRLLNCSGCKPAGQAGGKPERSIRVLKLEPDGLPVALLDLYSGGAHCCFVTHLYVPAGGGYHAIEHDWGDPGYRLKDFDHDGTIEFASADDRFAYAFTDFADSGMPIRIWKLLGGKLSDATHSFPNAIRADSTIWWRAYLKRRVGSYPYVRGILAAWAADEALLGRWDTAQAALQQALVRGDLDQNPDNVTATRYLANLRSFLRKNGYLPR